MSTSGIAGMITSTPGSWTELQVNLGQMDPMILASLAQMHAQQLATESLGPTQVMGQVNPAAPRVADMRFSRCTLPGGTETRPGPGVLGQVDPRHVAQPEALPCHLHVKSKGACKYCQRYNEAVGKINNGKPVSREVESTKSSVHQNDEDIRQQPLEIVDPKRYGFSPVLRTHVSGSAHYKELLSIETFDELVTEMYEFGDSVLPYMNNSNTTPSAMFCCLYRLFTIGIDRQQLLQLIEDMNNPRVRCVGMLFVRFGLPPEHLWPWLGEYTLDDQEFRPSKDSDSQMTIGQFVEDLLSQDKFYSVVLPRLPVPTRRLLQLKLAPITQYRKRARANMVLLDVYRHGHVHVEIKPDDEWLEGTVSELIEDTPSRPKASVRLKDGSERVVHLGRVVLTDRRYRRSGGGGRGTSRSRSPGRTDWARDKGRSDRELVDELRTRERERAVCASGKDYARRPIGYKHACAMSQELGSASARLAEDETTVASRRSGAEARILRSPSPGFRAQGRRAPSAEHQARMQQLFEKYGMAKGADPVGRVSDVEGPDFVRLG